MFIAMSLMAVVVIALFGGLAGPVDTDTPDNVRWNKNQEGGRKNDWHDDQY